MSPRPESHPRNDPALPTNGFKAPARASIIAFDACVQDRFKDVDEGFGIRRMTKIGETPHRFRPENVREDVAVSDLERERLRVVLYLTGRRVLQSNVPTAVRASLVKGPVQVTRTAADSESTPAPKAVDLQADSRGALTAFAKGQDYDFTAAGWTIIARPVRATGAACLRCHDEDGTTYTWPQHDRTPSLRVGDPLGVVLYAYRPMR